MATLYGSQYNNAFIAVPKEEINVKDYNGKIRSIYATWVPAAELAVSDIVKLAKLPAGAKLIYAHAVIPDSGATGTIHIGWSASVDSGEAADNDGVFASLAPGAAAINAEFNLNSTTAGIHKTFTRAVDLQIECTVVTTAATGATWKFRFDYVVE